MSQKRSPSFSLNVVTLTFSMRSQRVSIGKFMKRRLRALAHGLNRSPGISMIRYERFSALASALNRSYLIIEMPGDRFKPGANALKRRFIKLPIETRCDRIENVSVTTFNENDGERFCDIHCRSGIPLVALHHQMLECVLGANALPNLFDATDY